MIRYLPVSDLEKAMKLTASLWALACPSAIAKNTQNLFAPVTCTDGSVWLEVDTDFAIPVDAAANADAAVGLLGQLPAAVKTAFLQKINSAKGQSLVVWEAVPQVIKDQSRTHAEMVSSQLFQSHRTT